jgi:DNA ligase-associated metallophosphoesterase
VLVLMKSEQIELLPERAFFWPQKKILGLSDIHVGKAVSLQKLGIPIPSHDNDDLYNLADLIQKHQPEHIYILGDFIHQRNSWTPELINELHLFFESFKEVQFHLILGNHERGSIEILRTLPLQMSETDVRIGPLTFSHGHSRKENKNDQFFVQGHFHPVVVLREGSIRMRLPCFVKDNTSLTLPSFGVLTGGHEVTAAREQKIYACAGETVFEVPHL